MRSLILSALAALALPLAVQAQPRPFVVADLDALFDSEPRVEVNLRGALLRLAAEATRSDEPETAALIDGLRGVTVRIYPAPPADRIAIVSRLSDIGRQFEADGWLTLVRVRSLPDDPDNEGDVWVYVREAGDLFDGLAVLAVDEDEENAVFVHIDGTISPSDIGSLTRRFGDVDIDVDADIDRDVDIDDE
ncbi:DUF4252 domain-containing protein [Rubrivirga marina]|uniref:DUF4252 domain-containing protein n=1 Tax=Rubrivirga marina TaxID=1196024 RepID=A0A271J3R7_9BACT|nr:DUF4252 domain-containing protein [Rubrivirga marina]PAP77349.1 hypothetical protein BSZ37_13350 [Rubrivirga marina]